MTKHKPHFILGLLYLAIGTGLSACSQNTSHSGKFSIEDYKGKWVILNYWAEWCVPCLKEIPELNELNKKYASDLAVLAVNFDGISGDELRALSDKMQIEFTVVDPDPADILRLSRPAALPTTYIFGRDGILAAKLVGPQTEASLLAKTDIATSQH